MENYINWKKLISNDISCKFTRVKQFTKPIFYESIVQMKSF